MPHRHQIARPEKQVGLAKIHLTLLHLGSAQRHEQTVAIQFHLGPLVSMVGILGGQFMQTE